MPHAIMAKTASTQVGLLLLAGLLFLLALPLAFLALVSLEKLFSPTDLNHMTLEFLLIVATVGGLLCPLAVSTVSVAIAIAALFSPLYRGFIH